MWRPGYKDEKDRELSECLYSLVRYNDFTPRCRYEICNSSWYPPLEDCTLSHEPYKMVDNWMAKNAGKDRRNAPNFVQGPYATSINFLSRRYDFMRCGEICVRMEVPSKLTGLISDVQCMISDLVNARVFMLDKPLIIEQEPSFTDFFDIRSFVVGDDGYVFLTSVEDRLPTMRSFRDCNLPLYDRKLIEAKPHNAKRFLCEMVKSISSGEPILHFETIERDKMRKATARATESHTPKKPSEVSDASTVNPRFVPYVSFTPNLNECRDLIGVESVVTGPNLITHILYYDTFTDFMTTTYDYESVTGCEIENDFIDTRCRYRYTVLPMEDFDENVATIYRFCNYHGVLYAYNAKGKLLRIFTMANSCPECLQSLSLWRHFYDLPPKIPIIEKPLREAFDCDNYDYQPPYNSDSDISDDEITEDIESRKPIETSMKIMTSFRYEEAAPNSYFECVMCKVSRVRMPIAFGTLDTDYRVIFDSIYFTVHPITRELWFVDEVIGKSERTLYRIQVFTFEGDLVAMQLFGFPVIPIFDATDRVLLLASSSLWYAPRPLFATKPQKLLTFPPDVKIELGAGNVALDPYFSGYAGVDPMGVIRLMSNDRMSKKNVTMGGGDNISPPQAFCSFLPKGSGGSLSSAPSTFVPGHSKTSNGNSKTSGPPSKISKSSQSQKTATVSNKTKDIPISTVKQGKERALKKDQNKKTQHKIENVKMSKKINPKTSIPEQKVNRTIASVSSCTLPKEAPRNLPKPKPSVLREQPREDILYLDIQIRNLLSSRISSVTEMQSDLQTVLWIASSGVSSLDKLQAETQAAILRRRISDVEGGFEMMLYILRTSDLLDRYRRLTIELTPSSFVRTERPNPAKVALRREIQAEFLRIAREYLDLNSIPLGPIGNVCPSCFGTEFASEEKTSLMTCQTPGCGTQIEWLDDSPSFKDTDRVNMSSRYIYTTRGHFIDAMNRLEGKQNVEIDPFVLEILKRELALHHLDGILRMVTKDHLYTFLAEQKLGDYYEDINLIFFLITGISPPDITIYRAELLEMHDEVEIAYAEVRDPERTNSLNVNFKLYKLLQLLGFKCNKDDFYCLKTPTKQAEHDSKWVEIIDWLQAKFPNARTSNNLPKWRHLRTV